MELGINRFVDDISAEHLDRLRKELDDLPAYDLDSVMVRVAEHMHAACTAAFRAGKRRG